MIPYNSCFSKKVGVGLMMVVFSLVVVVQCGWSQMMNKENVPDEIKKAIDRAVEQVYPALVRIHVVEVN
jgi:hypothetical protein